jgi:competence ComEA-like helix-hairpin-helix protein
MFQSSRTLTAIAFLLTLNGCAKEEISSLPVDGDAVTMDWDKGETFHLAASYRRTNAKTEEAAVSLDDVSAGIAVPTFGEDWSSDVIWTYQVVESGFVPSPDDELYRFAETSNGVEALAVIKARLDGSLNSDAVMLETDPVVYMVFREGRDRMVGLISFVNVDGVREESAYGASELERSWSTLSQSMLTDAPTYLAPFSARWGDDERTLENGSAVTSVKVDDSTTDVFYADEMGGGTVVSRYEAGQPWPTWTTSGNVDVRMLSMDDVDMLRMDMAGFAPLPDGEDFDYREALQTAIDIDTALSIDLEELASGTVEASVAQAYKPWAGDWWSLKKGNLIWGYDDRGTFSDEIKEEVDPIKKDMDALSKELREMDDDAENREEKVEEYREKQKELVTIIKDFYNGLLADLDGGKVVIADGKISNAEAGWEYDVNELSPMDKFALVQYDEGNTHPNPFLISGWEILNSYNPGGESWWGHCNGWAAAAILTNEPREAIEVDLGDGKVSFTTADLKGLLTESHYSTRSQFYGERYNGEEDDLSDLTPKAFHQLVSFFIDELGVPMVFDTTAKEAVWNFPAYAYKMDITETTDPNEGTKVNVNTSDAETLAAVEGIGSEMASAIVEYRYNNGPFQDLEDIILIDSISQESYNVFSGALTLNPTQRTFDVTAKVTLTTDGVDEDHIDGDEPRNFTDTWKYSLEIDANGLVVGGEWKNEAKHPDFAWIPYHNTSRRETGGSENPFLSYGSLLDVVGEDIERR